MPRTRSQGQVQPPLPFPRRKSCRAPQQSKTAQPSKVALVSPNKPELRLPSPSRIGPISPRRSSDRPRLLSPRCSAAQSPLTSPKQKLDQLCRSAAQAPPPTPPSSPILQNRLPLSPRKRTGDDNGCNVQCSPLKQNRPNPATPRKLGFDENLQTSEVQAAKQRHSPTSKLSPNKQETPPGTPVLHSQEKKPPVAHLFADKSRFQSVKQALHTAIPECLLSRDAEQASIRSFLEDKVLQRVPSSLYISGAPGTGKTACLNCILQEMKSELASVKTVVVNCMSLRSSHGIFPLLAYKLKAAGGQSGLQRFLTAPGPTVLLVLDEMDQLDSKAQDVLYTIFEWPYLPRSRLCLIGIANALDLTDRILPRLQAQTHCRPLLLHFAPYSRQELSAIIQDRLSKVSAEGLLDASAVQFCARKVSAVSGDARKALDICRRAVEIAEADERQKASAKASLVGLPQVARVLSEVYGDRMASQSGGSDGESFPLQQKLLVCCLLLLIRKGKSKETNLGKLHEVYSRLCAQRQVSGVGQGECLALCSLLESRGIFALKKAKEARLTKVFLKIDEKDVENALKDRTLLGSILAAGLPS
ncbi:PREDICTED: cell division control protein 6 homolog [Poecilia mexicana]|uniref:Cell division control protein n=1 Tax=Poecilia mexicana TaxID=48701 RepID=A0A3B3XGC5_9TELE|nr:PREDICTED: cell division control protein 6 homolog [Poecilia mexicana]